MKPELQKSIAGNCTISSPPHVPEIRLHLATQQDTLWHKGEEALEALGLASPYWAFAWAGGQGLDGWQVILAGDVFYDTSLAADLIPWFDALSTRGATVLIGDPRRAYCPQQRLKLLATYQVPVVRELEDADVKRTLVWQYV